MSNGKISPVIIGVVILVIVAILIFVISLFSGKNETVNEISGGNLEVLAPVIELSLNTLEDNQEKVIISVSATTEDKQGIDYIQMPDGTKIFSNKKEYEVKENGKYEFKAVGVNGEEDSLSIEVTNIIEVSANNPYIPEGFEHISGEPDNGYTIQDKFGNQYVWVPVPTGILTRTTMMNSEYEESNSFSTNLVNSVTKNYGFYIARFEASLYEKDELTAAATIPDQIPWTNVSYQEAESAAKLAAEVFEYTGVTTALMNSYAWDTTLSWINQSVTNYSTNTSYGNYSGTIYPTGTTESDKVNNICDMAGNVREWTTEIYKTDTTNNKTSNAKDTAVLNRVVRGGSASINKIANSRNGYPENLTDGYWGFRTVLYKAN